MEADIRIIAATNRDLSKMVGEGTFREDLYYRINVIPVRLPSLRERVDDIPLLAEHFASKFAAQMGKPVSGVSGAAMACLQAYPWPGNIRELENAIERAVALERSPAILAESLPDAVRASSAVAVPPAAAAEGFPSQGFDLEQHVQHIEREYIAEALRRAGGVKVKAADLLGMSFRSFRYYMKKYNLKIGSGSGTRRSGLGQSAGSAFETQAADFRPGMLVPVRASPDRYGDAGTLIVANPSTSVAVAVAARFRRFCSGNCQKTPAAVDTNCRPAENWQEGGARRAPSNPPKRHVQDHLAGCFV